MGVGLRNAKGLIVRVPAGWPKTLTSDKVLCAAQADKPLVNCRRYSSLLSLPPVTCTRLPVMNEPSCEASST